MFKKSHIIILATFLLLTNICTAANIHVSISDNLIPTEGTVDVYRNNEKLMTIDIPQEGLSLKNLEYGTYRFVVINENYVTWSYTAFPHQEGYDTEIGNIKLTPEINTVSYRIEGDYPETKGSGFGSPNEKFKTIYNYPIYKNIQFSDIAIEVIVGSTLLILTGLYIIARKQMNKNKNNK
jgi:hypothetical protein